MNEGVAILLAAILALGSIFITASQQRRLLRKQHTYRVLEKMNEWADFETWLSTASSMIGFGKMPRATEPTEGTDQLDLLLNHYEFVSAAIVCGDVDETLVARVEKSRLTRVYLRFIPYIIENRQERGDNSMWENMEFLVYRWLVENRDEYGTLVDSIRGRPSLGRFQVQRAEIEKELLARASSLKWADQSPSARAPQ